MDLAQLATALGLNSIATYFLGMMAGKKKRLADLDTVRLANLEKAIEIYETIHKELQDQLNIVSARCKNLIIDMENAQSVMKKAQDENIDLMLTVAKLREENMSLKKKLDKMNEMLAEIKK